MMLEHNITFPQVDGIEFCLAGGAVRDMVMGNKPHDLDFVMLTSFSHTEVVDLLTNDDRFFVYDQRPEFNIILATERLDKKRRQIDLAFPRAEGTYSDGRRPDSTFRTSSLEKDASRRDFTINSMFMKENGEVIDYFGGLNDIQNKVIRTVNNPIDRFNEDALRIIRAMRFATILNFKIDEATSYAMKSRMSLITNKTIAMDRIRAEINKMLKANPDYAMRLMIEYELMYYLETKKEPFRFEMRQKD